jgi:hypothetical protein
VLPYTHVLRRLASRVGHVVVDAENCRHSSFVANGGTNLFSEICRFVTLGGCSLPDGRIPLPVFQALRSVRPLDVVFVCSVVDSCATCASLLFVILSLCDTGGSPLSMCKRSLFLPDFFCQNLDSWKLNTFSGIFASAVSAILHVNLSTTLKHTHTHAHTPQLKHTHANTTKAHTHRHTQCHLPYQKQLGNQTVSQHNQHHRPFLFSCLFLYYRTASPRCIKLCAAC